ncbi:hypothetical protein [Hyphomicrobium methylovorum]
MVDPCGSANAGLMLALIAKAASAAAAVLTTIAREALRISVLAPFVLRE